MKRVSKTTHFQIIQIKSKCVFLKLNLTDKGRRCEMVVRERNERKKHGKEPEFFKKDQSVQSNQEKQPGVEKSNCHFLCGSSMTLGKMER